ncbi:MULTISPECIES: EAL domain-containing protein [unclassified Arthrobacter]|uniref:EAL domain-containing protein n=1 Tax=unclassified Arthrobacter TaxID=235627 RepID=UPI002E0128C6|nr:MULTISPECIES: EAL domain-containing protein [unclassified Arthrobacter]MEC5193473.1 EAL domain-containing protein (putative c-di-GMP-specific phosphodiesterase class I) [Arthrobacter sp. MP_M4]MEC5204949.1 EAL domain-containing protein (putative c-di-GMP-specific phosphodiesterase class I) [Arthrobacter sp. MP_M7]
MACDGCTTSSQLDFDFSMAFQPIYDAVADRVWGYEALVRGLSGEGAFDVLSKVSPEQKYRFDQDCRIKAIELASRLYPAGEDLKLSINFMPNAVYEPAACLRATLLAAGRCSFPTSSIMFEFTENEEVADTAHLLNIITEYRKHGFTTAIDDFGAGHAGLGLLVDFQPDLIKIDMKLIRGIDTSPARQAVVAGIVGITRELDITVLAEGIETEAEFLVLQKTGIRLFQGYWFARPEFEALPRVHADVTAAA